MSIIGLGGYPLSSMTGPLIINKVPEDTAPKPGEVTGPQGALYAYGNPAGWAGTGFPDGGNLWGWPTQTAIGGAIGVGPTGCGTGGYGWNQYGWGGQAGWGAGLLPGYPAAWPGTYQNYRLLMMHPTLQLARSIVLGAMLTGTWNWPTKKNVPKEITDWAMEHFPRLRRKFILDAFRALDYGWYPFEKVYTLKDSLVTPEKLKPMEVSFTSILIDRQGNFAGLRPMQLYGMNIQQQEANKDGNYWPFDLLPNKAHLYTYDGEAGRLYGRARLENVRRAIGDYWQDNDHITRLTRKASGIVILIKVPPGGFTNTQTGQKIKWIDHAACLGQQIMSGTGSGYIVAENVIGFDLKADGTASAKAEAIREMAQTNLWGFETIDLGDSGPAMEALCTILKYKDNTIFRGYLLPERVGLEAAHGTKEESGTQTDTASASINATHDDITASFQAYMEECLTWNFGEEHARDIWPEAVRQNDLQEAIDRSIMLGIIQNKDLAEATTRGVDFEGLFLRRGFQKLATPRPPMPVNNEPDAAADSSSR